MTYQVLARKWRPRSFGEMVGQEHVLRALINALDNDRLHHAFLFTGTRGVGKTTVARILAKSLNCETGLTSRPCGTCSACREIDEGRFVDLIEVDAASRTKVEDTRELLENVQYAPTRGRYKVYLIDEVHMLSAHSFNALLKTLEEPPPHVKFLLATTDPQRLPVTILSRCLQFNLKRLPLELIQRQLARILTEEQLPFDAPAIALIARAADGSLRDALSLMDQAIAYGGNAVREPDVRAMLGTLEHGHVVALLETLAAGEGQPLMARVQQLAEQAPDYAGVLGELITLLHYIALAQVVPQALGDEVSDAEAVTRLAQQLSPEDVQLYYQIALLGRRDLPLAPDPRNGFEMVMLRMLAFRPAGQEARAPAATSPPSVAATPAPARAAPTAPPAPAKPSAAPAVAAPAAPATEWPAVVNALKLVGVTQQLAIHCTLKQRAGQAVELVLDPAHAQLLSRDRQQRLQQALQDYWGSPVQLTITQGAPVGDTPAAVRERENNERQQAAVQAIQSDQNVQTLLSTFNGEIIPNSVRPLD